MGGYGSGGYMGFSSKATCNAQHRIDIRYLKKIGVLSNSWGSGTLAWESRGERTGSIRYKREEDWLSLIYKAQRGNSDWCDIKQRIRLDQTSCNFGGYRYWFICPDCGKRIGVLYGAGIRFLCRHCYNLAYASQNETASDRLLRKTRKLRKRLGVSANLTEPVLFKPKGMHQKTFDELLRQLRQLEGAVVDNMISEMDRMRGLIL